MAPPTPTVDDDHTRQGKATAAHRLAGLLDDAFTVPGTRIRVGLDGLIGLIPGVGDVIGAALSALVIALAARAGAPCPVLARMAGNVLIETIIGLVPVLGDVFDFAWKANRKNVELLDEVVRDPDRTARRSAAWLIAGLAAIVLFVGAIIGGVYALLATATR